MSSTLKRMENVLDRLGIELMIKWQPDPDNHVHGGIKGNILFIFDQDENLAWTTFTHEVIEFKLKQVTEVYRVLINALVESYEKLCYKKKEEFIECLPHVIETIRKLKPAGSAIVEGS